MNKEQQRFKLFSTVSAEMGPGGGAPSPILIDNY